MTPELQFRAVSREDVRRARIPSDYSSCHRFCLETGNEDSGYSWRLRRVSLPRPFHKVYDSGDVNEWLPMYAESAPEAHFRFFGADDKSGLQGVLTWCEVRWNQTLWLIDIRVREDSRRSGIGMRLVRELQSEASRLAVRGISVETQTSNVPAVEFYRKCEFTVVGVHERLYSNSDVADHDVALYLFWECPG